MKAFLNLCVLMTLSMPALGARVLWQKVGDPTHADDIAACSNGTVVALNYDKTLWINELNGIDSGWAHVDTPTYARTITCLSNTLYALNTDQNLFMNGGSLGDISWRFFTRPQHADSIAGTSSLLYALNYDKNLYRTVRNSANWIHVGQPMYARKIAGSSGGRLFALNIDQNLFYNDSHGQDAAWKYLDQPSHAKAIAAVSNTLIYALNYDGSLWMGRIVP